MNSLPRKLLLLMLLVFFGAKTALASIIIQNNWQYTTATTAHSSDASATYQPLDFSNLFNRTSATATGDAKAYEDLFNGNNASVNLVFSLDFLVDTATYIGLSDHLLGSLFLGDTDSAHVDTFVHIIDQATNAIIASLPSRDHTRSGTAGTETFDESTPFSQHIFHLLPGDYLLESGMNLNAHATAGAGDDRMESSFSYTAALYDLPEPSTFSLLALGGLGVLFSARFSRRTRSRQTFL